MILLNLTASDEQEEIIKNYLEENVSEVLAEKINKGVEIVKDGKPLISKKTLTALWNMPVKKRRKERTRLW